MAVGKLVRNAARCRLCDETIESKHRHDFVTCSCGAVTVDGGLAYARRCWDGKAGAPEDVFEELCEYEADRG